MTKKSKPSKVKTRKSNNGLILFGSVFAFIGLFLIVRTLAAPAKTGTIEGPFGTAAFGSSVTFTAEWSGAVKGPRIYIQCKQDGKVVYGQLDTYKLNADGQSGSWTGPLGGGWSPWHQTSSQPADCTAQLMDYGVNWRKNVQDLIDTVSFPAAGQQ